MTETPDPDPGRDERGEPDAPTAQHPTQPPVPPPVPPPVQHAAPPPTYPPATGVGAPPPPFAAVPREPWVNPARRGALVAIAAGVAVALAGAAFLVGALVGWVGAHHDRGMHREVCSRRAVCVGPDRAGDRGPGQRHMGPGHRHRGPGQRGPGGPPSAPTAPTHLPSNVPS